jgi:hercynylcysteine S-oxide lyase
MLPDDLSFESISLALQEIARTPDGPQLSQYRFDPPLGHTSMLAQFREHLLSIKQELSSDTDTPPKIIAMIDSITSTPAVACPWKDMVNICREQGAWSIVDAAHSFGQEQHLNLADVDPDFLVAVSPSTHDGHALKRHSRTATSGSTHKGAAQFYTFR